jgi:Ca-activated chloride channel family protein
MTTRRWNHVSRAWVVAVLAAALGVAPASYGEETLSAAQYVVRGNEFLEAGEHEAALAEYRQAEVLMPESPRLAYNQGIAHYRMGEFARARELFSAALATRDLELEAKIKFNVGNCHYAEALEKMANLDEAIEQLRTAIEYYLDALEINPEDGDARANIETAQLLIKDLLDKLKKQQEQQQSSSPENQQQEGQQEQQESQQQEQEQPQDQGQQGQQQQEEDRQEDGQQQRPTDGEQEQQEPPEEQSAQPAEEERKMSREEAQALLQSVRDKEQQRRDEQSRRSRVGRARVVKDW